MQTYRVAVIGTGFAERVQLPGFARHERFETVALAARDPEGTRAVAEQFGIPRWSTDWRALVAEGGFDLLAITVPPHLHYEMVLAGLEAGCHILCEKPLALNAQQGAEMVAKAAASGKTVMIDHEFRYLAARARFGELVREGYIGQLKRLVVSFHADWRADPSRPWNWWSDWERAGGLLGAIGSHYFDAMRHWFRPPTRVWGTLSTWVEERPDPAGKGSRRVTADDAFVAVLDLGEGAEALFDFTAAARPGPGSRVTAFGDRGTLVIEEDRRLLGSQGGKVLADLPLTLLPREEEEPWLLAPFLCLLDELARGIDAGISPSPNLADGLAHQQFIDAVKRADATGAWVPFPPPEDGAWADVVPGR